jgi:hypothetical protein
MDDMPIFNPLVDEFMTFIPFRMGNEFISDDWKPEFYPYVKKAYKKLTGGKKLSELVEMVADNEDLDDIDRAYVMPGVALNHPDRSARRYLFRFFDFLKDASLSYDTDWDSYVGDYASYQSDNTTYKDGRVLYLDTPIEGGGGGGEGGGTGDPANTTPSPAEPAEPLTAIDIRSSGSWDGNFHMQMKWNSITKTTGSGIKSGSPSGTKTGDVWWGVSSEVDLNSEINFINHVVTSDRKSTTVQLTWQFADHWETLEIKGLKHKNIIKNGESADVKAKDALEDEEESAFLVPIHYETFRSLSLVDSTQMMTCCTYAVFTCYEVVKQKWYQTAFFKIIVFVVIIALTVFLGPEIGIAAGGILGSSAAVGAALGFAGLMAVLVGAIANAIAAMVLMAILQKVGTAVFGDKIGAIIAAVAGAIAMAVGGGLMNGQSMSAMWGNMMSAVNIIHMTAAVGNGIAGYIQGSAQEMMVKTQEMMAQYEKDSKRIQDMFVKEFGMGDFHWDPNMLTNTNFGGVSEIPQCFLDRTLLTGGDIAEMSLNMVRDFADMTLNLNTMGS